MNAKSVIGLGALAVGGYLLYNWLYSTPAATTTTTTTATGTAASTVAAVANHPIIGATLRAQMLALSGFTDTSLNNADQWAYYWNTLNVANGGAIPPDVFGALFVDPYAGDRSKQYTIDQFLAVLKTKGLAGLGKALGNIGLMTQPQVKLTATAYERAYKGYNLPIH